MPAIPITRVLGNPDRITRAGDDLLDDAADDLGVLEEQIVPGHPGLAREARGDHDDVGVGGLVVAVGADEGRVVSMNGTGLRQIERLALRDALDHGDQHDVAQFLLDCILGDGGADVAGAHYRDFRPAGSH
jgi:hypothetical protein